MPGILSKEWRLSSFPEWRLKTSQIWILLNWGLGIISEFDLDGIIRRYSAPQSGMNKYVYFRAIDPFKSIWLQYDLDHVFGVMNNSVRPRIYFTK